MRKVVYIAFNKRSVLTARALQNQLQNDLGDDYEVRIINKKAFKKKPLFLIRWGNSYIEAPEGCVDINPQQAVESAADKLKMAQALAEDKDSRFPDVSFDFNNNDLQRLKQSSKSNMLFCRNEHDQVRFRSNPIESDKYALADVDKAREFRVHVFNGKTIGVYEKIPMEGADANIRKNDNCHFTRMDMSDESTRNQLKGVRPAARSAVSTLNLLYGGVDVLISNSGEVFVNEVNSAPSLNGPNLERWSEAISDYIQKK